MFQLLKQECRFLAFLESLTPKVFYVDSLICCPDITGICVTIIQGEEERDDLTKKEE